MKIGELAEKTGCHVETIRYYQKVGLLKKPNTLPNGYGDYAEHHLAHLKLIRRAKELGFSQKEMFELVELARSPKNSCASVRDLTQKQLLNVESRTRALDEIKGALETMMSSCDKNTLDQCPTLTELLDVNSVERR